MRLPSSSNLALATLALSPSLLSSPVFGAPTPDVGGGLSPNPNTGYFAESPRPQVTDSPRLLDTPPFGTAPTFATSVEPPTAKIAGRRRPIKRQNSVKFRAVGPASATPEVIPVPVSNSHPTAATLSYDPTTTPVLIASDGSFYLPIPPHDRHESTKGAKDHQPHHLGSPFLNSPVPHDAPTFPPPVAFARRDVVGSVLPSTPSVSYAPILNGLGVQGVGVNGLIPPQALNGGNPNVLGTVDSVLKSVEDVVSNPHELSSLVNTLPVGPLAGGIPISSVSGISGALGEGTKMLQTIPSTPVVGQSSLVPGSGFPNVPVTSISGILGTGSSSIPGPNVLPVPIPVQTADPLKDVLEVVPPPVPISSFTPVLGGIDPGTVLSSAPSGGPTKSPIGGLNAPNAGLPIVSSKGGSDALGFNTLPVQPLNAVPLPVVEPLKTVSSGVSDSLGTVAGVAAGGVPIVGPPPVLGTSLLPPAPTGSLPTPGFGSAITPAPIPDTNKAPVSSALPDTSSTVPKIVGVPIFSGATSVVQSVAAAIPTDNLDAIPILGLPTSTSLLYVPTANPSVKLPADILPLTRPAEREEKAGATEHEGNQRIGTMGRPDETGVKDFGDWGVYDDEETASVGPTSTLKSSQPSWTLAPSHSGTHSRPTPMITTSQSAPETTTMTIHSTKPTAIPIVESASALERRSMVPLELLPILSSISVPPAHATALPLPVEAGSPASSASSCSGEDVVVSVIPSAQSTPVYLGGGALSRISERSQGPNLPATPSLRWCMSFPRTATSSLTSTATGAPANGQTK